MENVSNGNLTQSTSVEMGIIVQTAIGASSGNFILNINQLLKVSGMLIVDKLM